MNQTQKSDSQSIIKQFNLPEGCGVFTQISKKVLEYERISKKIWGHTHRSIELVAEAALLKGRKNSGAK